jgi:hypothetical protein
MSLPTRKSTACGNARKVGRGGPIVRAKTLACMPLVVQRKIHFEVIRLKLSSWTCYEMDRNQVKQYNTITSVQEKKLYCPSQTDGSYHRTSL